MHLSFERYKFNDIKIVSLRLLILFIKKIILSLYKNQLNDCTRAIYDLDDLKRAIDNYLEYHNDFSRVLTPYLKRCYEKNNLAPFDFLHLYISNTENDYLLRDFFSVLDKIYDPRKISIYKFRRLYNDKFLQLLEKSYEADFDIFENQLLNIGFQVPQTGDKYRLDEKFLLTTIDSSFIGFIDYLFGDYELYLKYSNNITLADKYQIRYIIRISEFENLKIREDWIK